MRRVKSEIIKRKYKSFASLYKGCRGQGGSAPCRPSQRAKSPKATTKTKQQQNKQKQQFKKAPHTKEAVKQRTNNNIKSRGNTQQCAVHRKKSVRRPRLTDFLHRRQAGAATAQSVRVPARMRAFTMAK